MKIGHQFAGWKYQGELVNSSYIVRSDMDIVADWTPIEYDIVYDFGGFGGWKTNANPQRTYTINDSYTPRGGTYINCTEAGYQFDRWDPSSLPRGTTKDEFIFTASWSKITYTVTFNKNGGDSVSQ